MRTANRAISVPDDQSVREGAAVGPIGGEDACRGAGNEEGHDNLRAFQQEIAEKDLSLTHTIVHPIVDKRIPDYEGVNEQLALKKV